MHEFDQIFPSLQGFSFMPNKIKKGHLTRLKDYMKNEAKGMLLTPDDNPKDWIFQLDGWYLEINHARLVFAFDMYLRFRGCAISINVKYLDGPAKN